MALKYNLSAFGTLCDQFVAGHPDVRTGISNVCEVSPFTDVSADTEVRLDWQEVFGIGV